MEEPVAQLRDAHSSYLGPHVTIAVDKDVGEQSLHGLLQLCLVLLQRAALRDQLLQLCLAGHSPLHQLSFAFSFHLTLDRGGGGGKGRGGKDGTYLIS